MIATSLTPPTRDQAPRGRLLLLARIGWVVVTLVTVGLDLYAIPALYQQSFTPCPDAGPCGASQIQASQLASLGAQGISPAAFALFTVIIQTVPLLLFVALAALLFWRRSDDRMALFCAYMLVLVGGTIIDEAFEALPITNAAAFFVVTTLAVVGQVGFTTFFLLFPDGHFVPRWTRWVAVAWALLWLASYLPGVGALAITSNPIPVVVVIVLVVSAQIYRFRHTTDAQQRQQTKWVVFGFATAMPLFAGLLILGNFVLNDAAKQNAIGGLVVNIFFTVLFMLIPVTISIAILRYRLYDIDVIIRRTLVYGSLTAILVAIYAICVVGAQAIVGGITGRAGEQSPLVIVATTLLIAALFQPLRRRIQAFIDRRFYRTKYDAEKMLATFGAALRSEVELGQLREHLLGAVEETMQPAHTSLWLRPSVVAGPQAMPQKDRGDA